MAHSGFEPRIIGFLCNWCTYTGADLAGTSRLQYPPNLRVIRLMCSGAVDVSYVLKPLLWVLYPVVWFVNLFVAPLLALARVKQRGREK